jgi:hypothetical protein
VLRNNFVRGAVSGLGVVNLYAGFMDLAAVLTRSSVAAADSTRPRFS